jgi:hypothetical protein
MAIIWSIPIAIVVIGAPIALLVKLVQMLAARSERFRAVAR